MNAKLLSTEHFCARNSLKNDSKLEGAKDVEVAYIVDEGSDTD